MVHAARSTSSRACSSPRARSRTGCSTSPTSFPIRHFFEAFFAAWDPATAGAGFEWGDLAIVAAWGIAGLLIAMKTFRWEPRALARPLADRVLAVIHHVSVEVADLERSGSFYDAVLGPLGWRRQIDTDERIAWGIVRPIFYAVERDGAARRAAATSASARTGSRR